MNTMQIYNIEVQYPDKVMPGQFIYENNESDVVVGFLLGKDGNYATIVLFNPVPAIPTATIIHPGPLPKEEWQVLLAALFIKYPEARELWLELFNENTQQ